MPLPQPAVPLQNPCTIIYDGRLFAYQANAFQALDLKEGGTWSQLSMGVPTNGSSCVQGNIDGKAAFILVGGTTSAADYHGLQHYDLSTNEWVNDHPLDGVAVDRLHHGTAFLEQSSSILMYAGSQDNTTMKSTQTFVLRTQSPYDVQAFESSAPPVINPLMLSYNATHAIMIGGDPSNTRISTFSVEDGWRDFNVTLKTGLKDSSKVQATIWTGSDGSKVLEIFDLSVTPNQVSSVVLTDRSAANGTQKTPRSDTFSQQHPPRRRKRDSKLTDRPTYNSTGAPEDQRVGFSLSADADTGLVVAIGGNSQQPFAIFNDTSNQWIDPGPFFVGQPSHTSISPSSIPTATATASSSPAATTVPPGAAGHSRNRSLAILGGVLGGVIGAAVLLVLILILLRLHRKQRDKRREMQKPEYDMETKGDPMDFSDIGATYMTDAGGSATASLNPVHQRSKSDRSVDPRTIDRNVTASSESKRALLHAKGDSAGSSRSFWGRSGKSDERSPPPQISAPILGPPLSRTLLSPEPRNDPRAETGWSRYFTNNNSHEILSNVHNSQQAQFVDARPETYLSNSKSSSDHSSSRIASSHPHESAEVEPLSFRGSQPLLPSAALASYPPNLHPGLGLAITQDSSLDQCRETDSARLSTPVSNMSDAEYHDYSHESEAHDSWTPVAASGERNSNWTDERPISSVESGRGYAPSGEPVEIPVFPMPKSDHNNPAASPTVRTARNERIDLSQDPNYYSDNSQQLGLRNVITKDLIRTRSGRLQATSDVRTGTQRMIQGSTTVGPSSASVPMEQLFHSFPRPRDQRDFNAGGQQAEDMSWLNLGTSAEHPERDTYFTGR